MIQHAWTVLCSKSIIDQDTNNITLVDVIEQIQVQEAREGVMIPIRFEIVTLWTRARPDSPAKGRARFQLETPSGTVARTSDGDFAIDLSEYQRMRHRYVTLGMPVPEVGRYYFRLELQEEGEQTWREITRVPLEIVLGRSSDEA